MGCPCLTWILSSPTTDKGLSGVGWGVHAWGTYKAMMSADLGFQLLNRGRILSHGRDPGQGT